MKPLQKLAEASLANGSKIELMLRDGSYLLLEDGVQLASSFSHGGDDALANSLATPILRANQPCFLLQGLELGFVLAGLRGLIRKEKARFVVAEPFAEMPKWHKQFLADLHEGQMEDPRVEVQTAELQQVALANPATFHGIAIKSLHTRYKLSALEASQLAASLRGGGFLAILISRADNRLVRTLTHVGYHVDVQQVAANHKGKQTRTHTLILARKGYYTNAQLAAQG